MMNILTFIGFLFVFEFVIGLIEPRLQLFTKDQPILMLLSNGLIALTIFPIQKYFKRKITSQALADATSLPSV
jgi:hypothetical protein